MWELSTHDRARGNFPVLTGTKMVVKIKDNVQCRVVLIQTDMEKMSETNERIIIFSGTTKRQAKQFDMIPRRIFSKKDR